MSEEQLKGPEPRAMTARMIQAQERVHQMKCWTPWQHRSHWKMTQPWRACFGFLSSFSGACRLRGENCF